MEEGRTEEAEMEAKQAAGRDFVKRIFGMFPDPQGEVEEAMPLADLPMALRLCGYAPTEGELEEIRGVADPERSGFVRFESFLDAMTHCFYNFRSGEDLREAFRMFDPENRGVLTATDLRFILSSFGDKMSDAEINSFLELSKMDFDPEGNVAYDDLIARLVPEFLRSS